MKGINTAQLVQIVNFIYTGETLVDNEELDSFLETANLLKVKGLETNVEIHTLKKENDNVEENQSEGDVDDENSDKTQPLLENLQSKGMEMSNGADEKEEKKPKVDLMRDNHEELMMTERSRCKRCGQTFELRGGLKGHKGKHLCQKLTLNREKVKCAKFQQSWLEMSIRGEQVSAWLVQDLENRQQGMCTLCPSKPTFSLNDGWKDVKQHYRTVTHQENKIFAKCKTQEV